MIRLGEKQKKFMCERIARFVKRSRIIEESIREFMLDDTPQVRDQLYRKIDYFQCHPNAKRWQEFIERTRAGWLTDMADVPLANRKMRLMELARFYERCSERLNSALDEDEAERVASSALKILKQIREEADSIIAQKESADPYATGFENLSDEELLETAREIGIQVPETLAAAMLERKKD